jgi:hypothetical protein
MIGTNTDIDMDIDICCMRQAIIRNVSLRSLFQKVKWGTWKSLWKGGGRTGPGVGGEIFRGCPWDILCYFTVPGRSKTYQFVLWRASLLLRFFIWTGWLILAFRRWQGGTNFIGVGKEHVWMGSPALLDTVCGYPVF